MNLLAGFCQFRLNSFIQSFFLALLAARLVERRKVSLTEAVLLLPILRREGISLPSMVRTVSVAASFLPPL